ncbi:MAG TPA: superoxide dismutase family protein [Rhizomicrobium sp.]|nr:superoxide dismutase family protein [Rhizomicrobium sp.]
MTRVFTVSLLALALLGAPAGAAQKARAIARLASLEGKPLGTVEFSAVNRGVLITFDLHDLSPGAHGIHLHTSGNCDAKTGFTAAGPILTLIPGKQHGYLAEGGPEAGDLPNQFAGSDGKLHASVVTTGFSLGNGKRSIFDRDGVAIIVDARGDDYRTQPLGNAGDRIACGVVMRTVGPAARHKPHKP